ncbi:MAG TPA: IPT/TIG domain-containing protein [Candidatus Sulfotelmatobacter sp.]|nr:IPT/TIG domain-containing protein [Candidatus Sulfotelmatobacter sp.]
MKILNTLILATLAVATVACGYGSKNYAAAPGTMPAISQLNPNSATAGGSAFTLTVNGSNFGTKAVVNWNGAPQSTTTYISANQLMVTVPASMISASGNVQVTVTNPATAGSGMYGGVQAATSSPAIFTID